MGCCGQKRAQMRDALTQATTPAATAQPPVSSSPAWASAPAPAWAPPANSTVSIRYLESSPVLVRGPVTGRNYQFSGARPIQPVDARDAEALLRTRFFRRSY